MATDEQARRTALRKSCDGRYAYACVYLAAMAAQSTGGPRDLALARKLDEQACADGLAIGCAQAATLADAAGDGAAALRLTRRGCALGSSDACLAATDDGDTMGQLRAARRALKGSPIASLDAAAQVTCPPDTSATLIPNDGQLGGPETFCARADGKKHGPFIEWRSREDLDEGPPSGVMHTRGGYADDLKSGEWTVWDDKGHLRDHGAYAAGVQEGAWELDGVRGTFVHGLREGVWTEYRADGERATPYVHGKKQGELVIKNTDGGVFLREQYKDDQREGTSIRTWPNGQRCVATYVADKQVGKDKCNR